MNRREKALTQILETKSRGGCRLLLKAALLESPLGTMIAVGDEKALYLLECMDYLGFEDEVERLKKKTKAAITPGITPPIDSIKKELGHYFKGKLKEFKTPLFFQGTAFQKRVWEELKKIPFGETRSYSEVAVLIGKPTACRAVARANATNQIAIVIPCHRVINASGDLGGYNSGIKRKAWLLNHEKTSLSEV
jgi:AraC family transcriptional regulator, regulatory protein of adaptative response / methylated-DNA-[protein]-cysteine methyltransferase